MVEVSVEFFGLVCALRKNLDFSMERGKDFGGVDAVDELGGGCRAEGILAPRQACLAFEGGRELKGSFKTFHVWYAFGFPSNYEQSLGN